MEQENTVFLSDFIIIGHHSQMGQFRRSIMNKEISLAEAKATLSECIRGRAH